jgi:rhamnogalacturonyl hydrolase YesR
VFWGRGNGWMLAAMARILQETPQGHPTYDSLALRFTEMAKGVLACQSDDGLWRPSLLSPESFTGPDTSASALFTFALAWGERAGLLPSNIRPELMRAWVGLCEAVDTDGCLGWVQPCGWEPVQVHPSDTVEFGVGALLLAGGELLVR